VNHPANDYDFDTLASEFDVRRLAGLIRATTAPDNDALTLYCYTQSAVVDAAWDPFVEVARGIVLDANTRRVIARPFPKFFNFGERSASLPDEPFEAFEKLDGSLGVIFHDGVRWRVTTKGSFAAPQAAWAQEWLDARDLTGLVSGTTYLAEIIYRANRIVVRYDFEGLILLGAYDAAGVELPYVAVQWVAELLGTRAAHRTTYESFDALRADVAGFDADREGFVVRFASGYRVKVKGAAYLRIHRLISRVTPLAVWDALAHGVDLATVRRELPEEFWSDFDAIVRALTAQHDDVVRRVEAARAAWEGASDKDVGLALGTLDADVRPLIFVARRGGANWHAAEKTRAALWRPLRPTGNVLAGYSQSVHLATAQEAA